MKRAITIIMTLCVVGLCGCDRSQNPVIISTGSGAIEQTTSTGSSGTEVDVNANANIGTSPDSPNSADRLNPVPMIGWSPWHGITITAKANECTINSNGRIADAAGITQTGMDTLRGRTLVLYFANTTASSFNDGRMVKVGLKGGKALVPSNAFLIEGEYLLAIDTPDSEGIEYQIPDDFDGQLDFVFYQANLNNLKITAYYK
ncbi:MAG: hypothetical protein LBH07_05730 [Treponema sp.]|nr:hypothetical protein [Treponema sp.]